MHYFKNNNCTFDCLSLMLLFLGGNLLTWNQIFFAHEDLSLGY